MLGIFAGNKIKVNQICFFVFRVYTMKILYVHNQKRIRTGAHQFNNMIVTELRRQGHIVDTVYPNENINLLSPILKGINSILFFYSMIQKRREMYKYDIIQGTTYTTLAFLENGVPTISHFGSTTKGFLKNVPSTKGLEQEHKKLTEIYQHLKKAGVIENVNPVTKAIKDISDIEMYVAKKSDTVVAASQNVKKELENCGVHSEKIRVIHNAIEDFWFKTNINTTVKPRADLVYLGRMGDDSFTIKLKGINRLIHIFNKFPKVRKVLIGMSGKKTQEYRKVFSEIPKTFPYFSLKKKLIPRVLNGHYGDIYVNTGRYEGFCLSLVEAMSQGLVPVIFPIGVAPEIIENGKNGYIVNSLEEMENKIKHLIGRKELRAKMAEAAVETSKMFEPQKIIPQYINLYDELHRQHKYGDLLVFAENRQN